MRKKKRESEAESDLRISGVDFGNIELPDLDLSLFDVLNDEYNEETRYIKPKVYEVKPEYVLYDNAVNPELYDFYDDHLSRIVEKYATIRKPVRGNDLWAELIKKKFND